MLRDDLQVLLAKVEAATGPDREIDCLIWKIAEPERTIMFDAGKAFGRGPKHSATYGKLSDFPLKNWDDWEAVARHIEAPTLTASIDAALALLERMLPENGKVEQLIGWGVSKLSGNELQFDCFLYIDHGPETRAEGNTAPLAILAALLKALIAAAGAP